MDQQLKELCINCESDSDLKACLEKYTKPRLRQILDAYRIKMPAAAKKQEIVDKAENVIMENVENYFMSDGKCRKEDMYGIINNGMTLTAYDNLGSVNELLDKGIVYLRNNGEDAEVFIPAAIKSVIETTLESSQDNSEESCNADERQIREGSQDRSEQDRDVIKYAAALANMYGVYPANQVKETWDFNHQRAISPNDVRSALLKAGEADGFYINDSSYIITTMLPSAEDYLTALDNIRHSDTYYYPSEEIIDEFASGPVYKVAPEYYFLRSYIAKKLGDEKQAEDVIDELYIICARDDDDSKVISFINDKGVQFDDDDDRRRFMYLYTCWGYELRIWQCKGYKPSELRAEKLVNRNFCRPDLGEPKKIKFTGRNDECPCGSGKKYKKCCMKYAE